MIRPKGIETETSEGNGAFMKLISLVSHLHWKAAFFISCFLASTDTLLGQIDALRLHQ